MWQTILDLLRSKKFIAMMLAILAYIGGQLASKLGIQIDPDTLTKIYNAILVYIGAQGLADWGKGAAQVNKQ